MTLPPFHPEAAEELDAEAAYYDKRHTGLGSDFLDEVRSVAIDAALNPFHGSPFGRFTRRRKLHRFPHWLVYVPTDEGITVVAIAHPSRTPGYWNDRL